MGVFMDFLPSIDLPSVVEEWKALLSVPVDAAPLSLFRMIYGAVFFVYYLVVWKEKVFVYTYSSLYFHFELTPFVVPLSRRGMNVLMGIQTFSALCLSVGFFSSFSAFFLCLSSAYMMLIEKAYYTNHHYFHVLICLLLGVVDAGRVLSLDSWLWGNTEQGSVLPFWQVMIFKLQVLIVYSYGGLSKLNKDWLIRLMPIRQMFGDTVYYFLQRNLGAWSDGDYVQRRIRFFSFRFLPFLMAWAGLFVDLFVVWFMLFENTFYFGLAVYLGFSVFNHWFFYLGTFPYMNYTVLILFFDESYSRWIVDALCGGESEVSGLLPQISDFEFVLFLSYLLVQIAVPLRRFVKTYLIRLGKSDIHSDNAWYFSWNMMHAVKQGEVKFIVYDLSTNEPLSLEAVSSEDIRLRRQQERFLKVHPRFVIQYVKYLENILKKYGYKNFGIRVDSKVDINCRGMKRKIDPKVNLCVEEVSPFGSYAWILDD
jgi:hypothetical protein